MRRAIPVCLCLLVGTSAFAHQRSMSFSRWVIGKDSATVQFRISQLELTRFPTGVFDMSYLTSRLVLLRDGVECPPASDVREIAAADGWAVFEWTIPFKPGGELAIRSDIFLDIISTHQHFVRLQYAGSDTITEKLLRGTNRVWTLGARPTGNRFVDYVRMGVEHILQGWDHLSFVITLLLIAVSLREVAVLITGFTVAHSITLALAVLGIVRPVAPVVEIYVAFSIAIIAVENFWWQGKSDRFAPMALALLLLGGGIATLTGAGILSVTAWAGLILFTFAYFAAIQEVDHPFRLRAIITFTFGLVHGFGFAGVLMNVGLSSGRTALGLFGFNAGVELGQLAVVLLVWPALSAMRRLARGRLYPGFAEAGSAATLGLATYWFVTRNWG